MTETSDFLVIGGGVAGVGAGGPWCIIPSSESACPMPKILAS